MALCRRNRGKLSTAPSRVEGDRALPRGRGVEGLSSARRRGGEAGFPAPRGCCRRDDEICSFFEPKWRDFLARGGGEGGMGLPASGGAANGTTGFVTFWERGGGTFQRSIGGGGAGFPTPQGTTNEMTLQATVEIPSARGNGKKMGCRSRRNQLVRPVRQSNYRFK